MNISYTPMTNNDLLEIQQQRVDNAKSIIVGHLNINSIRNKFIFAESIVKAFDLFLVSESKLDSTFPMNQFHIFGFKVFRLDHNRFGGGLILYINENIPCRPLNDHPTFPNLELIAIEIHQNKRRWLFIGMYKPPSQSDREFTNRLSSIIDYYLPKYENLILIGDFNLSIENQHLDALIQAYNLNNLINKPTCFQSNTPTCIDLILTNKKDLFKLSNTFETGISDHHKLVSTILKSGSFKGTPKIKIYRSYKNFELENFDRILKDKLEKLINHSYAEFEKVFLKELNKHAPLKKKVLRHNNNAFMTKELRKEIMWRSKLKNKFNKERNHINWCNYKRQRNCCLSILRKSKKEYFNSLNMKQVSDNKLFWKSVKPFFNDKGSNSSKITLVEENNIISDEKEIANIMNNYFINVTKTLNLKKQLGLVRSGVNEFENHISIKMIHEKYPEILPESFKFQFLSNNEVKKEIENLDTKKSSRYGSIPATILKQCVNAYLPHLTNSINYSIQHSNFPQELKLSEVIPVYKKLDPLQKENYRPVSLLPHVSKIFERIIHKQITNYMTDKLAHSITGFIKSHRTQNSLVVMLEK